MTSSCHPNQTTLNIPFSLALRIVRICSVEEQREQRFLELKYFLLDREYKPGLVDSAINRARAIPRKEALKESVTDPSTTLGRPIFAVTWDPRLPSIPSIQNKHWRSMVSQNPYLAEVFSEPPLTAYKRQRNIRDHIVRAKVPPPQGHYPKRQINGVKKCERGCIICPFVKEAKHVKANKFTWSINSKVNCHTRNIVYLIQCIKENCNLRYIGESERELRDRISEHVGYIRTKKLSEATGEHFNLKGHTLSHMKVTILEKVTSRDELYRKERESFHIRRFNTFYKGINKKP